MENQVWLLFCVVLVVFMQAGFCLLESSNVRPKNRSNVAMKNVTDFCLSGLIFYLVGFGLMYGKSINGFFGFDLFLEIQPEGIPHFLFQLVFCSTAITIASGMIAERMKFHAYLLLIIVASLFIYPIVGHWVWYGDEALYKMGWLKKIGFKDFAGAGVVHLCGSMIGLATLKIIGPRLRRYSLECREEFNQINVTLFVLGVFILWLGWLGFNGGTMVPRGRSLGSIILTTLMGGAGGGSTMLIFELFRLGKVSPKFVLNGILAGLVGVTGVAGWISPTLAVPVAAVGALICRYSMDLMDRFQWDDVVYAFPVHGVVGAYSLLILPIVIDDEYLINGLSRLNLFGFQALGVLAISVWSFGVTFLVLKFVDVFLPLRVSQGDEEEGLDVVEHSLEPLVSKEAVAPKMSPLQKLVEERGTQKTSASDSNLSGDKKEYQEDDIKSFYSRIVSVSIFTFILLSLAMGIWISKSIQNVLHENLKQLMGGELKIINSFRNLYTEKVVQVAKEAGIKISHQVGLDKGSIPLPATLTMMISEDSNDKTLGQSTYLYSKYPFPWRKKQSELKLDSHREKTIDSISKNPNNGIMEKVAVDGIEYYRYSIADTMGPACVACHNSHPESPFRQWKVGDVRGVLEIQMSAETVEAIAVGKMGVNFLYLGLVLVFGLLSFIFILARFKRIALVSQHSLIQVREQKKALKKTVEVKTRFFANMSHELRTPLNGILGILQIFDQDKVTLEQKQHLKNIKSSGDRLLQLINSILDLSENTAQKSEIVVLPTDIVSILKTIEMMYSGVAKAKGLNFKVIGLSNDGGKWLLLDKLKVKQVLTKVIGNAIKFTHQGEVILKFELIEEENNQGHLNFEISDTGIGIAKNRLETIFLSYEEEDKTANSNFEGSGLGLAISKSIVEKLGGQINVESENGKGTVFKISIPVQSCEAPIDSISLDRDLKFDLKALIAEDNPINAMVLEGILENMGVEYATVENGQLALQAVKDEYFDVIFMDYKMPVMDGYLATQEIFKLDLIRPPVVIGVTANTFKEDILKLIDVGMHIVLAKPIQKNQIADVLEKIQSMKEINQSIKASS